MDPKENPWALMLLAYLHDPAEKALILLRAQGGHEEGSSVAELRRLFFPNNEWVNRADPWIRTADRWASAADRPAFPKPDEAEERKATEVRFWDSRSGGGVLVHPISGETFEIEGDLYLDRASKITGAVLEHIQTLLGSFKGKNLIEDRKSAKSAFYTLWRLAPQEGPSALKLGALWRLLPADTRIPDHSIWEHLSLTSAFAGAMAQDGKGRPALLVFSIGPVQSFLAQSRATADLWGASHLLSFGLFQALEPLLEKLGPQAVLFPNLWGNPFVDLWLQKNYGIFREDLPWKKWHSDRNPLCRASLPNRFLALVPQDHAQALAEDAERTVRAFFRRSAVRAATRAFGQEELPSFTRQQVERQMAELPEVSWSIIPWGDLLEWGAVEKGGGSTPVLGHKRLEEVLSLYYPETASPPGFLGSPAVALVQGKRPVRFFDPNPAFYYPAFFDLAVRNLEAVRASRLFAVSVEEGYRCTLCGEREWLAPQEGMRFQRFSEFKTEEDPWKRAPAPVREGEHLCAPCCLKRYWFKEFQGWVKETAGQLEFFPLSTYTLAVAPDLANALKSDPPRDSSQFKALEALKRLPETGERVALPHQTVQELRESEKLSICRKVIALLDKEKEAEESEETLQRVREFLGHTPEAYYGIVLFDGDRMGAVLNGVDLPKLGDCFHRHIEGFIRKKRAEDPDLARYLNSPRPLSPSFHHCLSASLADFASWLAPFVVEECYCGKVIYAGGDDLLAMVAGRDLIPCIWALRALYSGDGDLWKALDGCRRADIKVAKGFVRLGGSQPRLYRTLSPKLTASVGAVLAHHKMPLQVVLRKVREAEQRAKASGRNAFSVALLKRSGSEGHWTSSFRAKNPSALEDLRALLARPEVSRRAAYHVLSWMPSLPLDSANFREMVVQALVYQFVRQGAERSLAQKVLEGWVDHCFSSLQLLHDGTSLRESLIQSLTLAEFLARECRSISRADGPEKGP